MSGVAQSRPWPCTASSGKASEGRQQKPTSSRGRTVDDIPSPEPMLENGDREDSGTPCLAHPFMVSQEALSCPREWKAVRHGLGQIPGFKSQLCHLAGAGPTPSLFISISSSGEHQVFPQGAVRLEQDGGWEL